MPSSARSAPAALALAALLPLAASALGEDDPAARYRETAGRILGRALVDEGAWRKLEHLTTRIGHRLSGSPGLEKAVAWAHEGMEAEGLEGVRLQPVRVPRWVRGREWARVVSPVERDLPMLGLGMSVGTPKDGITAPVVVVRGFEELNALGREKVQGKIVAFAPDWEGYGRTVRFRSSGASAAAKLGALAVLVRSATGRSIASPHTGALSYEDGAPRIPAAGITVEDAEWLRRMADFGETVTVSLSMEARLEGEADSANVIAEIRGSEKPDEVVVMGGHYDSWDVGPGSPRRRLRMHGRLAGPHAPEGDGPAPAPHAAGRAVDERGERPQRRHGVPRGPRTERLEPRRRYRDGRRLRASRWASASGGRGRAAPRRRAAGARPPSPSDPDARRALATLRRVGSLFSGIDAAPVKWGGGGADISPLTREGVPGLSLDTVGDHYFDWHHTQADTIDKVDPDDLRRATGMLAVMGYVLADLPDRLVP